MTLKLEQREKSWWITGLPTGFRDCGPFETRKEANEDRASIQRTLDHLDDHDFWCVPDKYVPKEVI